MAWPSAPSEEVDERLADLLVLGGGDGGDRVLGDDVDVLGDLDHVGGVAGGDDVGDVDDAGVGLPGGHLGDHAADVLLEADRGHGDAGGGEDLVGVVAARHLRGADHGLDVGVGEVGDAGDAERVARGDDDRQQVGGEDLRLAAVEAGVGELVHVGGVGGGEHVGRGALGDLLHERRGGVEAERRLGVRVGRRERLADLGERLGQRRRGEHGDVALHPGRGRGRRRLGGRGGGGGRLGGGLGRGGGGRCRRRGAGRRAPPSSSSSPQAAATQGQGGDGDEEQARRLGHDRHCSQVLSSTMKDLTTLTACACHRDRCVASRPDRLRLCVVPTRLPFAEWVCLTLITPEGVPRLGAGHDARPRRRARPDLDAEPAAHLPGDRRPRRQGPDHPDRPGRRPRPRPGHPRRHPGRTTSRQEVARHPGRAPARRAHRAARQAVPARPGRPRQRGVCSPRSSSCSHRRSTP